MLVDDHIANSPAIAALRIRQGPSADKVVSHIEELSRIPAGELTEANKTEIHTSYRLLALSCPRGDSSSSGRTIDDLTVSQLRLRFDGANTGTGLLFSQGCWYRPSDVRRGPAIFGARRAFAPDSTYLDRLWTTLRIAPPNAHDAIEVLRELATAPLSDSDKVIVIESVRLMANELANLSPQTRARLKKMPLWTGRRWTVERPVYAVDDEAVATALREENPVWMPGCAVDQLQPLLDALQITYIAPDVFKPIVSRGQGPADVNGLRIRFALAVQHLRTELARGDQELSRKLRRSWEELATSAIVIDSALEITAELPGHRSLAAPTNAHLIFEPLTLFARAEADVGSAQSGGRAIATLFDGDRQKLAWAWEVMWQRAENGEATERIVLSTDRKREEPGEDRLARLQEQSSERRIRGAASASGKAGINKAGRPPVKTRVLKNLHELTPTAGRIINKGAERGGVLLPPKPATKPANDIVANQKTTSILRSKAVLPSMDEREQLAYDAVKMALGFDDDEIRDLRQLRGIGADAVDELRQFFEIKMASGADFPSEITLTASEYDRARTDPDFFLAVVCGLEDKAGKLRVRFIFDPVGQLQLKIRNDITLAGVRDAEAIEHEFEKRLREAEA